MITQESKVEVLKGVGPAIAKKLQSLGVQTVFDLIDYLPRRYDDFSDLQKTKTLKPGVVTLRARIQHVKGRYVRRGMHITEAVATDETGSVKLVWFNQPYRETQLKSDQEYYVSGEFAFRRQQFSILNPSVERTSEFPLHTARIIPIYKETKGFTSSQIRSCVGQAIDLMRTLPETLPPWVIKSELLMSRDKAYEAIHFPQSTDHLVLARRRFAFEEVFQLILASLLVREDARQTKAQAITFNENTAKTFVKHLSFQLTDAQRKAVWAIYQDIKTDTPMNRLLEGDVGSGKTVVAAMAAVMTMQSELQVALMAPTELLARQHAETLHKLLQPLGMADRVCLLVGGMTTAQKRKAYQAVESGQAQFIVGTHALIQDKVDMHSLALVIVDEQHRFGVDQRKKLIKKSGHAPHILSMTATPIPRSLALTLYGELDVTILDQKPSNRKVIQTTLVPPTDRPKLYEQINQELDRGRQAFVVCPVIQESSSLLVKSAEEVYAQLSKSVFKDRRIGLLHGKMKAENKDAIMQQFVRHELDILVSTTVIEVGVDVPNATVMLVENPERFGLAQLHQLRGRVGRSEHQGYCYLMLADSKAPSRRLRALAQSHDGFRLAELDLELRGPGAIYGTLQHGALDLRIAQLSDHKLIAAARKSATMFIKNKENLLHYPELHQHIIELQKVTRLN